MRRKISKIISLYKKAQKTESNFYAVFLKQLYYYFFYRKNIIAHQNTTIKGVKNISTNGLLNIGVQYVGFSHSNDVTLLNIGGKLILKSGYSIGRGCRFDIAENAIVSFGKGGYTNVNTKFIIMHGIQVGDNCVISWDCQFLDEDFHKVYYDGRENKPKEIIIGNNVWIGAGAKIYQGTRVADGSVIAANAVVRGQFLEKNTIIGGNPAKVVKSSIKWE